MSEKIMPFPNGVLFKKESNIWIYQLLSRINNLFLPNQLCLPLTLDSKPNRSPKWLNSRKQEITVQEGICYQKCILVASSTVLPSKPLISHIEGSPLYHCHTRRVEAIFLSVPLKRKLVLTWQRWGEQDTSCLAQCYHWHQIQKLLHYVGVATILSSG